MTKLSVFLDILLFRVLSEKNYNFLLELEKLMSFFTGVSDSTLDSIEELKMGLLLMLLWKILWVEICEDSILIGL